MKHEAPHDPSDLLLAPMALRIDQQLDQLSGLSPRELEMYVCLQTDSDARTHEERRTLLLEALTRDVDTRAWELSWEERGLALRHAGRHLVLGTPDSVRHYLAG
jgi:hypothetical protein